MDTGVDVVDFLLRFALWGCGRIFRGQWCAGITGGLFERLGAFLWLCPDDRAGFRLGLCADNLKPAGEQAIGGVDGQFDKLALRFPMRSAE